MTAQILLNESLLVMNMNYGLINNKQIYVYLVVDKYLKK